MNEGMTLKQQVIVKKQAYEDRKRAAEHIRRRSESQSRKQEEMKKKLESSLQQNKQREQEGMKVLYWVFTIKLNPCEIQGGLSKKKAYLKSKALTLVSTSELQITNSLGNFKIPTCIRRALL